MRTKEQVIEYLKSQEWFEQFKTNVKKYRPLENFEEYLEKCLEKRPNTRLIAGAFVWWDTPEGNMFWKEKDRELKDYCEYENE